MHLTLVMLNCWLCNNKNYSQNISLVMLLLVIFNFLLSSLGAIEEKFGEVQFVKQWPLICQSLNQKCLDSRKKNTKRRKLTEAARDKNY